MQRRLQRLNHRIDRLLCGLMVKKIYGHWQSTEHKKTSQLLYHADWLQAVRTEQEDGQRLLLLLAECIEQLRHFCHYHVSTIA
jgi:hypothetical protein